MMEKMHTLQDYKYTLLMNGWEPFYYDGMLRSAPPSMRHIFRDLAAGFYLVGSGGEILVNPLNEPLVFRTMSQESFRAAYLSLLLMLAIRAGVVFIEILRTGANITPANTEVHGIVAELSHGRNRYGFYAYNTAIEKLEYAEPYSSLDSLLISMATDTPFELGRNSTELYGMTRLEMQQLVVDMRHKLDLLEFNLEGNALW